LESMGLSYRAILLTEMPWTRVLDTPRFRPRRY
jgi:hypothetical protein